MKTVETSLRDAVNSSEDPGRPCGCCPLPQPLEGRVLVAQKNMNDKILLTKTEKKIDDKKSSGRNNQNEHVVWLVSNQGFPAVFNNFPAILQSDNFTGCSSVAEQLREERRRWPREIKRTSDQVWQRTSVGMERFFYSLTRHPFKSLCRT